MILFPAIDLKDGQCVRLYKGRFEEKTVYGDDPAAMAARWANEGATWIHLVDLDGSLGQNEANRQAIIDIRKKVQVKLQLGGGLRSLENIDRWADLGIDRFILGTVVCETPQLVTEAAAKYPGRVAVALDAVGEKIKVRGWVEDGGCNLFETAARLKDLGASAIIYTDVERDGAQIGPNLDFTQKVAEVSRLPVIASGGIAKLDDIKAIKKMKNSGLIGAISGKALYEGNFDFAEAQQLFLID